METVADLAVYGLAMLVLLALLLADFAPMEWLQDEFPWGKNRKHG